MNAVSGRLREQPVRPSLQALHAQCSPPSLVESLDDLEEVLEGFGEDLSQLVKRLSPVLHPVEDDLVQPALTEMDLDTAPAVCRVREVRRRLSVMHDQLFDAASRIAL